MQNIVEAFKNLFQTLSRATRTIFKYLHWMCKKYRSVFPTIDHIANETGCDRRTVFRVLNRLVDLGFLSIRNRPYHSNIYFIDEELLKLDLADSKTFERESQNVTENVTPNVTVVSSISDINKSHEENDDASKEAENIERLKQAVVNKNLPLNPHNVDFFCIRYGFEAVKSILKRIVKNSKLEKKFKNLDNPCGYLTVCLQNEKSA